jgi:hypothetical protein
LNAVQLNPGGHPAPQEPQLVDVAGVSQPLSLAGLLGRLQFEAESVQNELQKPLAQDFAITPLPVQARSQPPQWSVSV